LALDEPALKNAESHLVSMDHSPIVRQEKTARRFRKPSSGYTQRQPGYSSITKEPKKVKP